MRRSDPQLTALLTARRVAMHSFVRAELALGTIKNRRRVLTELARLPHLPQATDAEVSHLVETAPLIGRGIGLVDTHLLAATLLAPGSRLLTRDKRLASVADDLTIRFEATA